MDDLGHLEELILKRIKEYDYKTPIKDANKDTFDQLKKIAPVIPVM